MSSVGSGIISTQKSWTSGLYNYEVLHDDIERLVSMKSGMYTIPGFDRDDIAQEIRMMCLKALEKYEPSKNHSTPFNYLARCVDNRLRNLLRDNGATIAKAKKEDERAIKRCEQKMRLQTALPIGDEVHEDSLGSAPIVNDITEFVDAVQAQLLSPELKASFSLLITQGPPAISKVHLRIIKRTIREVYPDLL